MKTYQTRQNPSPESADSTALFRKVTAATGLALLAVTAATKASTDYPPAIWKPLNNYYTTGNGHKFHVIHDMEGYYASVYSVLSSRGVSVHYAVNGKQDASSDAPAGEVSQFVRDANYAWHASCWNTHSTGTEHEGFASNPAWYTEVQYQASAGVTRHLAAVFGWAKDRNHIVAHGEKSNSAWVSWAGPNLGITATCNTHTDPGPYWDWPHYMALVRGVREKVCDFNGDGVSDIGVFNPPDGYWKVRLLWNVQWAWPNDIAVPGDYNGDGKTDVCVFRPSTGEWINRDGVPTVQWGWTGDIPVPADYNGDGKTDIAVFRPTTGEWIVKDQFTVQWAWSGDVPVPGDYNGDGKADVCVYRPSTGEWINRSMPTVQWGWPNDVPVPGDYNGDGDTDVCVYRPSTGEWINRDGVATVSWGLAGEIPQPADYNGDGKTDICVYSKPDGMWKARGMWNIQWGLQGQIPLCLPYAIRKPYFGFNQ